ncbi:MAG: metallophosphoesterase [Myxococcales bacterium]|nr:metallophosphoesterase [Myxococcales bacterium]
MHAHTRVIGALALLVSIALGCADRGDGDASSSPTTLTPTRTVWLSPLRSSTAGASKPSDRRLRFAVISDSNDRYGSQAQGIGVESAITTITQRILPAFVIHNGDLIAGQSRRLSRRRVEMMWRGYHDAVTIPLANRGIPLFPVPGNHDASPNDRLPDRGLYEEQWLEPAHRPRWPLFDPYRYPFSYSFIAANTLLVVLDAPTGRLSRGDLAWLRVTLGASKSFDRVLVFAHVPFAPYLERSYGTLRPARPILRILARRHAHLFTGHYEIFFDGHFANLRTTSTGQLSHTCRVPIGGSICQGMSFLVVDLDAERAPRLAITALRGPRFESRFDPYALPLELGSYWRSPTLPHDLRGMLEEPPLGFDLSTLGLD